MSIIVGLSVIALRGYGETEIPSYDDLCKYDKFCSQLKSFDGSLSQPKQNILEFVSSFSDVIKEKAQKMGVDPRAVAGSILAENSLNVQVDDTVQDFLVQMRLAPKASIMGKQFSIGMGQIHLDSAMEAEKGLAQKLGRKERTEEEVSQALLTPDGAIEYATGIVYHAQECYKQQNIDISNDPAILTTLYNLGKACDKAKESASTGTRPKPNYFGWFVGKNLPSINRYLDKKNGNQEYKEPIGSEKDQYLDETIVYGNVPACGKLGAGKAGEYFQATSYRQPAISGSVKGNFRVISRDVDCDLKAWDMIQDSSGRTGWISSEELNQKAKISPNRLSRVSSQFFDCKVDATCVDKLKSSLGKDFVKFDDETGLAYVKYLGKKSSIPSDPALFASGGCMNNDGGEMYSKYALPVGEPKELSENNIKKYLKQFEQLKKKMMEKFSIKEQDWPKHPLYTSISGYISQLEACKTVKCRSYPDQFSKLFSVPLPGGNSLSDLLKYSNQIQSNIISIYQEAPATVNTQVGEKSGQKAMMGMGMMGMGGYYSNNGSTVETVIKSFEKCKKSVSSDAQAKKDMEKVLVELKKVYSKQNLNVWGLNATDWLCDRINERIDHKKPTYPNCDACVVNINLQGMFGQIPTHVLAGYLPELKIQEMVDIVKKSLAQAVQNFSYTIPGLQKSWARGSAPGMDMEKSCNYEPFKNKDRIESLLKDNCYSKIFTNDPFLVGSLRNSNKQVLPFKTTYTDQFTLQIARKCGQGQQFLNKTNESQGVK
ncbi:MAG: DUF1402 family protein [Pseudobdellovibrionaceae bacterium]